MKITTIRLAQKTNLGNYESLDFAAEAVIDDEDKLNVATGNLELFVDWHAKKPIRDKQANTYRAALADPATGPELKAAAEGWLKLYEARKAAVEAL